MVARVSHSPKIPRQAPGDEAGLRSSWEVKSGVYTDEFTTCSTFYKSSMLTFVLIAIPKTAFFPDLGLLFFT